MRPDDKKIFLAAAKKFNTWILVRRTNPKSLQFIGKPGFTPKRIDCKAKTADDGKVAGLVVDADIHKNAFKVSKIESALSCWRKMKPELGRGQYAVDTRPGTYYGCLMLNGKYIHGDYDLYDIIIQGQEMRNLAVVEALLGQPHRRGPKLNEIKDYINGEIGVEMIQHGGEAQYADHSEQSIDAFGPGGEDTTILNEYSVRAWYRDKFMGRPTLPSPKH